MIVDQMIKWLLAKLKGKVTVVVVETPVIDTDNIYYRLKMAYGRVTSNPVDLTVKAAGLGRIETYCDTLEEFLKSLLEVNDAVKQKQYIERGFPYIKDIKSIGFDKFLFVRGNFYVKDAPDLLQLVLEQIEVYLEQMQHSHLAAHGVVEYNHRRLYAYTNTIIHFLDAIFDHFGQ